MPQKSKPAIVRHPDKPPDDPEQSERFIKAAKAAGADETEKGADKAFRRAVSHGKRPKRD